VKVALQLPTFSPKGQPEVSADYLKMIILDEYSGQICYEEQESRISTADKMYYYCFCLKRLYRVSQEAILENYSSWDSNLGFKN